MKKFLLSFVSLFILALTSWAQEPIKTLTFPDNNDKGVGSYTAEWTATVDGETWSLSGFNNNNNGWAYVKCGQKSAENTASISTPAFAAKVTSVVYTIDKTANVTSAIFTVVKAGETVATQDVTRQFAASTAPVDVTVEVADAVAGQVYTLTIVSSAQSNGSTQLSKVAVYGELDASIIQAPSFSVAGGDYYAAQSVEISCATEGATIMYSTDGENYSVYSEAITVAEDATLYAYAEKSGMTTSTTATASYRIAKTYASLAELAVVTPEGQPVIVTLDSEEITKIYVTSKGARNGVYVMAGEKEIEIYCYDVPETWEVGGTLTGTVQGAWKDYNGTWEVCPSSWEGLTYAAKAPESDFTGNVIISPADGSELSSIEEGMKLTFTFEGAKTVEVKSAGAQLFDEDREYILGMYAPEYSEAGNISVEGNVVTIQMGQDDNYTETPEGVEGLYAIAMMNAVVDGSIEFVKDVEDYWELSFTVNSEPTPEPANLLADGDYILKNVETGLFLGGANSWGTQASLVKHGQRFTLASEGELGANVYSLDSHTYNNGTDHFLTAGLYVDGGKTNWTIAEAGEGVYTLTADGTNFLAAPAEGNVAIKVADATAAAAQWQVLSIAELTENMQPGDDATFLLKGAAVSRNLYNRDFDAVWTTTGYNTNDAVGNCNLGGGNNENQCAESWRSANGFDVRQTIDVPNGKYVLNAQAVCNDYNNTSNIPVVYANEVESPFNTDVEGATNMGQISTAFTAGKYAVEPIEVVVSGGKLTIGVKCSNTALWALWDNFELTYVEGVSLDGYKEEFAKLQEKAESLKDSPMNATVRQELNDAAQLVPEESVAGYEEVLKTLGDAVSAAEASVVVYENLLAIVNQANDFDDAGKAAFLSAAGSAYYALSTAAVTDGVEEAQVLKTALVAGAKAQNTPGSDMTLVMPAEWIGQSGTYQDCVERFSETSYEPGKILYQHIEGLTPGTYEVQFIAAANLAAWQGQTGAGPDIAQVFVNDVTEDIEVIDQKACNPADYLRTLTATVGEDGVLEYGLQNIATGGCWYVAKAVKLTFVEGVPENQFAGTYLIKNKRTGKYAVWKGDDTQIGQEPEKSLAAVWNVIPNGETYKLGNHETDKFYATTTSFTEEGTPVYILESEFNEGYFVISETADASANCWDDQGNTKTVGYWRPAANDNQGTSWEMIPVDVDQLVLELEMADLLAEATEAYDANTAYIKGEGLITSVDQLSSPYTEPSEGALAFLIDGDASSFWHSAWSAGAPGHGVHYLDIALPENTLGEIEFSFTRRNTANNHLTQVELIGINGEETTSVAVLDLPHGSNTETLTPHFVLEQSFETLRLLEKKTTGNDGFWHAAEIQLYPVELDPTCINARVADVAAAMEAAIEAAQEVAAAPTQADIDALKAALETYQNSLPIKAGYYAFINKRTGKYAIWTGDDTKIGQSAVKSMAAIWKVVEDGENYKLGNYETENLYASNVSFTEEGATVYLLKSEFNEGYYVISETADASANCWDDQDNTNGVGYWHPSATDNQGTSWKIVPVDPEQFKLDIEMVNLLAEATEAYEANTAYVRGDGLITSVDQLSSPYTETNEGALANLIDGNTSNFWHSAWSAGAVANGVHYLEIALPAGTTGEVELSYTRRSGVTSDHLTEAEIIGVNGEETTTIAVLNMPYTNNTETMTPHFVLDQEFEAIRILELNTNSSRGFWHAAELQLYPVELDSECLNAQAAEAAAAMEAAIEAGKTVVEAPTQGDIDALKAALEAYLKSMEAVGVNSIDLANANAAIYNIAGQRVSKAQKGLFIINGKKVLVK